MRTLGTVAVLALGIGGLGVWGNAVHAPRMQSQITDAATSLTKDQPHGVTVDVIGRDISVTGLVEDEAARDALLKELNNVDGRRVVRSALDVLPKADPYTFAVTRKGEDMIYQGHVPRDAVRADLATLGGNGSDALILATGAPEGWSQATRAGITALSALEEGVVRFEGQDVRLSGTARTPAERDAALAALQDMPEGYDTVTDFDLLDDGKAPAFTFDWDITKGGGLSGKLPAGLNAEDISSALGIDKLDVDVTEGLVGADQAGRATEVLSVLGEWLSQIEKGKLAFGDGIARLQATPAPGADVDLLRSALRDALGGAEVNLSEPSGQSTEGQIRNNVLTGEKERMINGFWLPELSFRAEATTCSSQSAQALERSRIGFVTGSAQLGPKSLTALNRLAAVVRPCVLLGGLRAELGGHTDNTGDAQKNFELSFARAQSVQAALVARGVPESSLKAVGYGQNKPIADNGTPEGRARNRRTTITWFAGE